MNGTEEDSLPELLVRSSSSKSTGTAASGSLMSGLSDIVQNIDEVGGVFNISRENSEIENTIELTETEDVIAPPANISSSASGSSASISGIGGGILSPGGELSELVSGIDDVDRIPTDEYIDIAGMHHSSPIKGFTFGGTPNISNLAGATGANIAATPSSAFLKASPSLLLSSASSSSWSQQSTSKAEVLLSWKYESGASGHNKPSLTDTYRMQMEGLRRNNGDISSRLGIAGKNKSSRHMDKKKRRPNGSSTNGDDVIGIVNTDKKDKSKKSSSNKSKSGEASNKKNSKKTEEDLLWEQEMGKSDYYYSDDQQRLQDLTSHWENNWENDDDDDDDDDMVNLDVGEDDDEVGNDDDDDDDNNNDCVDDEEDQECDISIDGEDDNMIINRSVDSDDDSDSMASLSSGLDSVTLDALMEVGSNHSASMTDDFSSGMDGGTGAGDMKIMSSMFVNTNESTVAGSVHIQKAIPVLNMNDIASTETKNTTSVAATVGVDQMTLSPLTLRAKSITPLSFPSEMEIKTKIPKKKKASKTSSISDTVYHGKRQTVRQQVVADIVTGGKKTNRGKYKCGRCGQSKQGHVCEYVLQTDVCSTGTQVEEWGIGNHPFHTEKTLTVKIRDINIVNGSAVVHNTGNDAKSYSEGYANGDVLPPQLQTEQHVM